MFTTSRDLYWTKDRCYLLCVTDIFQFKFKIWVCENMVHHVYKDISGDAATNLKTPLSTNSGYLKWPNWQQVTGYTQPPAVVNRPPTAHTPSKHHPRKLVFFHTCSSQQKIKRIHRSLHPQHTRYSGKGSSGVRFVKMTPKTFKLAGTKAGNQIKRTVAALGWGHKNTRWSTWAGHLYVLLQSEDIRIKNNRFHLNVNLLD